MVALRLDSLSGTIWKLFHSIGYAIGCPNLPQNVDGTFTEMHSVLLYGTAVYIVAYGSQQKLKKLRKIRVIFAEKSSRPISFDYIL